MENTKRIIKYQYKESKISMSKFWLTMFLVSLFLYIINKRSGPNVSSGIIVSGDITSISILGVSLFALLIYLIIFNYENLYKNFPMAISFSVTRKDFALSTIFKGLVIAATSGLIQGVLLKLDPIIVRLVDKTPMYDFGIFNTNTDNIIYLIFTLFIILFTVSSMWNLLASLNYRFGYKLWIVFLGLYFISSFIRSWHAGIWTFSINILTTRIDGVQLLKLVLITIISQGLAYLNTINTNIKRKA